MLSLMGTLLGLLALTGVVRVMLIYLINRFNLKFGKSWVVANILTVVLRLLFAVPQLINDPNLLINMIVLFFIYMLEQGIWFLYDYIQQRRNNAPATWGIIWGIIIGGLLWLFIIQSLVVYGSRLIINAL